MLLWCASSNTMERRRQGSYFNFVCPLRTVLLWCVSSNAMKRKRQGPYFNFVCPPCAVLLWCPSSNAMERRRQVHTSTLFVPYLPLPPRHLTFSKKFGQIPDLMGNFHCQIAHRLGLTKCQLPHFLNR